MNLANDLGLSYAQKVALFEVLEVADEENANFA